MSEEKTDFHLIDEQPSTKKDWEISDLYSKAWQVVKNHKVTWIFGAAVAATAAGSSGNFRSTNSLDSESLQKLFGGMPKDATSSAEMSKVLGESINPFQQLFTDIWQRIPTHYYGIFIAEILFLIIVAIFITLIFKAWAHASLIESVYSAYKHNKTTIAEASEAGFKHIKSFIWLDIVPALGLFVISFICLIAIFLGFIIGNTAVKMVSGLLAIIGTITLIYYSILVTVGVIWGYREAAISNLNGKQAFWNGFKIAKQKKGASLLLGFVNSFAALIVTIVPLLIIFGVGTSAVISYVMTKEIPVFLIGATILATLIILPIMMLLGAIIQAFKASIWTIAYDKIKGKYTHES